MQKDLQTKVSEKTGRSALHIGAETEHAFNLILEWEIKIVIYPFRQTLMIVSAQE